MTPQEKRTVVAGVAVVAALVLYGVANMLYLGWLARLGKGVFHVGVKS
jgi:hypothetical protein